MDVFRRRRDGLLALQRVHDADAARQAHGFIHVHGLRMGDHEVMLDLDGLADLERLVRREVARDVTVLRDGPGLVERGPFAHAVAVVLEADLCKVQEGVNRRTVQPVAVLEERQRRVEMMQRDERLDALGDALVDELVIVGDALLVHGADAIRDDARPGNGDADAVDAEGLAEAQILLVLMIEVAGRVAVIAAPGAVQILIPGAGAAAILRRRTLDLIGRRGAAEDKALRKIFRCHSALLISDASAGACRCLRAASPSSDDPAHAR